MSIEHELREAAKPINGWAKPGRAELMLRAADELSRLRTQIEEFGTSRVRDRVAARVGCNHDILHDALQQEVRRALSEREGQEE